MSVRLQALKVCVLEQLAGVSRHVDIVSPNLEPALFDRDEVASTFASLARRGPQTRIRLLIGDDQPGAYGCHRLIALSRRLSTACTLRVLREHPEWNRETLMLVDRTRGVVVTPSEKKSRILETRAETQRWADTFERLWHAGSESLELRQFY